jgi:hypothetical protein
VNTALLGLSTELDVGNVELVCSDDVAGVPPRDDERSDQLQESSTDWGRSGAGVNDPLVRPGAKLQLCSASPTQHTSSK